MFAPILLEGTGLHTGAHCVALVEAGLPGTGGVLIIDDSSFPITIEAVDPTAVRNTTVHGVKTVEHLLAALVICGELDVRITVQGPELPILDGSAEPWLSALLEMGAAPTPRFVTCQDPVEISVGPSLAIIAPLTPAGKPTIELSIDFHRPELGHQRIVFAPLDDDFAGTIAPARTFALVDDALELRQDGWAKGGSLDNALVIGPDGPINEQGYRLTDEPVRHKLIDALGDLFFLGGLPWATVKLVKPSHRLMHELVRRARPLVQQGAP